MLFGIPAMCCPGTIMMDEHKTSKVCPAYKVSQTPIDRLFCAQQKMKQTPASDLTKRQRQRLCKASKKYNCTYANHFEFTDYKPESQRNDPIKLNKRLLDLINTIPEMVDSEMGFRACQLCGKWTIVCEDDGPFVYSNKCMCLSCFMDVSSSDEDTDDEDNPQKQVSSKHCRQSKEAQTCSTG